MDARFITTRDPLYAEERALRAEILRKPLGLPPGSEVFPFEEASLHLVAIEAGHVIGCVLFHPNGKSGRLYQMAVARCSQRHGVGRGLVAILEERLRAEGIEEIWLHAREEAVPFYAKLGYAVVGERFSEVGIAHWKMHKSVIGDS
jgi:ribosomal protein S18 acetylase RimI-like enzyme